MRVALDEARKAFDADEVPVGAAVFSVSGQLLSACHNQVIGLCDPTCHAEMSAIRQAARWVDNYRLLNTLLYVTIEPCVMCMGAIIHARIAGVVFGARDAKWGAAGSLYNFAENPDLNHRVHVISGVLEKECRALMQTFFQMKRKPVAS